MSRTVLINVVFFLAFGSSLILIKRFMDASILVEQRHYDTTPDAYMINASYLQTNEQGQRDTILFTPKITHYQHQDTSFFEMPKIYVYKNNQEWQVTSKQAKGLNGAKTLHFFDDVKVVQFPSAKNAGTTLSTQQLTVFTKEKLVTTTAPVTIEQPGLKINAVGLRGDLSAGTITLLSKTRGQYDPKKMH